MKKLKITAYQPFAAEEPVLCDDLAFSPWELKPLFSLDRFRADNPRWTELEFADPDSFMDVFKLWRSKCVAELSLSIERHGWGMLFYEGDWCRVSYLEEA